MLAIDLCRFFLTLILFSFLVDDSYHPVFFQVECRLLLFAGIRLLVENPAFRAEGRPDKNRYQPGVLSHEAASFEAASCCTQYLMRKLGEKAEMTHNFFL